MLRNFEPETICGYYVSEKQKRTWAVQLDLLERLLEVCKKHDLKCFVAHGTLLGAVRHKGFIPWDDDIDVNMPRGDYEKLKTIARKEFRAPYFFQDESGEDNCFFGFGKLRNSNTTGIVHKDIGRNCNNGISIDVFPMDGVFENAQARKEQAKRIEHYRTLMEAKLYGEQFFSFYRCNSNKWADYIIQAREMELGEINKKFIEALSECDYDKAERVGIHCLRTEYECCYWYKKDFEELTLLDFEGLKVPAPKNYDRCLIIKWNNYMKFPPENERGYKHAAEIHDPYISYDKYDVSIFLNIFKNIGDKKILLFGAGAVFDNYMEKYGSIWRPECVFDNNRNKWGSKINGIEVKNPELLKEYNSDDVRIIATTIYCQDIDEQLKEMGVPKCYKYIQGYRY